MQEQTALWHPSESFIENSNLKAFEKWLQKEKGFSFQNYQDLWEWSVKDVGRFWEAIWKYFDIIHHQPYNQALSNASMPGARWFEGATLNYAEHIFRHQTDDRPAIIFKSERVDKKEITWKSLTQQVAAVQQYLISKGVGQGDRVAAYLPNIPETIICFLAVNGLGAIWTCCSPDFGVSTVIERFAQVEPKLLIAVDGYQYNGKPYNRLAELSELQQALPCIEETVLIPYLKEDLKTHPSLTKIVLWENAVSASTETTQPVFTAVPFDHPIWVLYSSGTTGKPKAITHSHGGVLLEHLKYMAFHNDAKAGEHFFWFTTTGWMMWNFLQASMLVGAIPILYDGSPGYPNLDVLWQTAADLPIHHFGTSAPYLVACMKKGLSPKKHGLEPLRSIGSTGAPLPPEAFEWIYQEVSENVWLCSMSGGTDVCTAFVGGCPYEPVYKGAIQSRALGCALYAYDDDGQPITGSLGEMVIDQPMPSMPVFFWNDPDGARYKASYFEHFPGKWRHGDWIKLFPNGSLIIQGRSDATLNRKGIRIGTAEIYNVLEGIESLKDSIILNLEKSDGDDIMPLFVVLQEDQQLDEGLEKAIKHELRLRCSPRHVPDVIIPVPDVPYTLSGKKMEVPIKKILMGMDGSKSLNKDATRNPEAVQFFIEYVDDFTATYLN